MEFKQEIVQCYSFFSEMEKEVADGILNSIIVNDYEMGHRLFSANQSCSGFSLILSGSVRVYRIGEDGREVTIYRLRKGDSCIKTIVCVLNNVDNTTFAEVEENARIAMVPIDVFKNKLLRDTSFMQFAFKNLYKKFESVIDMVENVTFNSIESRLISYFDEIAGPDKTVAIVYTTHEKLAADIGSTREVVSRSLKALEKRGMLELSRGKVKYLKGNK